MKMFKFKWTFIEPLLGSSTANPEIYRDYLAKNAPEVKLSEEEEAVLAANYSPDEEFQKAMTIHPKLPDGTPFQYDYQVKGYFKDACSALNRLTGKDPVTGKKKKAVNESSKLKAFKKEIDGNIFVFPRCIPIKFDGELDICERSLRASTPQGERICLAASEKAPEGSTMVFWVLCLNEDHIAAVMEWMDFGILRGTGQWRNSGMGRFTYEILDEYVPKSFKDAAERGVMVE